MRSSKNDSTLCRQRSKVPIIFTESRRYHKGFSSEFTAQHCALVSSEQQQDKTKLLASNEMNDVFCTAAQPSLGLSADPVGWIYFTTKHFESQIDIDIR